MGENGPVASGGSHAATSHQRARRTPQDAGDEIEAYLGGPGKALVFEGMRMVILAIGTVAATYGLLATLTFGTPAAIAVSASLVLVSGLVIQRSSWRRPASRRVAWMIAYPWLWVLLGFAGAHLAAQVGW